MNSFSVSHNSKLVTSNFPLCFCFTISSHTHPVSMTAVISPVTGCSSVLLLVLMALSLLLVQQVLVTDLTHGPSERLNSCLMGLTGF